MRTPTQAHAGGPAESRPAENSYDTAPRRTEETEAALAVALEKIALAEAQRAAQSAEAAASLELLTSSLREAEAALGAELQRLTAPMISELASVAKRASVDYDAVREQKNKFAESSTFTLAFHELPVFYSG